MHTRCNARHWRPCLTPAAPASEQELIPHLRDPARHLEFLSARLGPGRECIDARAPRAALVAVLASMARHPRCKHLQRPIKLLEDMHA